MIDDTAFWSITKLAPKIAAREISPVEITTTMLERISDIDDWLNSFITVLAEHATSAAKAAEAAILRGDYRGPLHGVPVAVKDLFATRDVRTTFGSLRFAGWVPDHDAAVVERLHEAGAIILGKTNLDEVAMGTTSANPHFGPVRNPWKVDHHPGGSSGGSAAAVAAGLAFMGLGSDTGASICQPAACCGIVGIKPTYGRIPKHGCLPLAWSMDHIGPINRTVKDAALTLNVLAGHDPRDPGSVDQPVPDFATDIDAGVDGMRLGLVRPFFTNDGNGEVVAAIEAAGAQFETLGALVEETILPEATTLFAIGTLTIAVEAANYHADHLHNWPNNYSPQVRSLLELGHFYKATDYLQAQRIRQLLMTEVAEAMAPFDALILPTCPITATPIEDCTPGDMVLRMRNTIPFNVLGLPCMSQPCGFSQNGLPIGLQIVGRAWDEVGIFQIGHAYEQTTNWHERHPVSVGASI